MQDQLFFEYSKQRNQLIQEKESIIYEGLNFSELELHVNEKYKIQLLNHRKTHKHTFYFPNTLQYIDEIYKDPIYHCLKIMPKGVIHHIHGDIAVSHQKFCDLILRNENSYYNDQEQIFKYFKTSLEAQQKGFLSTKYAYENGNKEELDKKFKRYFTIQNDETANYDINIWDIFQKKIFSVLGLIYYKDIYKQYLYMSMEDYINDGILRVEARMFVGFVFDEDGNKISNDDLIKLVKEVINEIRKIEPLFEFVYIIQGKKIWDKETTMNCLRNAFELRKKYPEMVIGFDMVQEEDQFKYLNEIAEQLVMIQNLEKEFEIDMPLFLHAGESLNSIENKNVYDALLLGSKRIGHGLGLLQHSSLMEEYKKNNICVEICPISNQILRYYNDIRLHPIKALLTYGVKVSISPDDPSLFGTIGVSVDYYVASVGNLLDLKDLKKIIKNSIEFCFQELEYKNKIWEITQQRWNLWIQQIDQILI